MKSDVYWDNLNVIVQIKVIVIAIVGLRMGNITNASHPLPQIWERINSRYLRHRLTQEIIEEHSVLLPSQQEQQAVTTALKKRISLHHASIAKVIYYRMPQDRSICQQFQSNYEVFIYTEYTGDTLERVAQEKGERLYHSPCQCTHILSAAEYLKDHHGFFGIKPSMIFLGNRKEKNTRVWINSKVELSERQVPADEQQMCQSLYKLFRYLRSHRICLVLTDDQIENAYKIRKLSQLKTFIFDTHRTRDDSYRHKKSNSAAIFNQDKNQEFKINSLERNDRSEKSETNKKNHTVKANSMPQKNEESKLQKSFEVFNLKPKEINDQNKLLNKANNIKNPSPDIYYRPLHSHNPLKVNFIYPQYEGSRPVEIRQAEVVPQPRQFSLQIHPQSINIAKIGESNKNHFINKFDNKSLFSANIEELAASRQENNVNSVHLSPQSIKKQPDIGNFTARQMELPLQEAEEKITPARLPTTSRSPKANKEGDIKQIQKPPEIIHNRYQRKISAQTAKSWKDKEKGCNMSSSGNKFEKYKDQIKIYEQKLRQKLANSVGSANPASIKPKGHLAVRKTTSSPKAAGQCKQTKSVYNDSDDEPICQPIKMKPQLPVPFAKFDSQQSIPERDDSHNPAKELTDKQLEGIINSKELTNKKIRQRLEKMELQRQLQKEKMIIKNQMQDLLKQNAMRDEYRSIREKIKQKKQTFAQLKAEATKILQDLEY